MLRTAMHVLGKFLISVGLGILLFVAWTLWGTKFQTDRAQAELEREFAQAAEIPVTRDQEEGLVVPESFKPKPGEGVFKIRIPKIQLRDVVVEGVGVEELQTGPGHYPECRRGFERPLCTEFEEVWPGENGRVIVSAHRTTYGREFWDLDKMRKGNEIILETRWGDFTYLVTGQDVVPADTRAIAVPSESPELVLTTCNPRFSAAERLIVYAKLQGEIDPEAQ